MSRNIFLAAVIAFVAIATPANALDVKVLVDKAAYKTNDLVHINAIVSDYVPQSRIRFVVSQSETNEACLAHRARPKATCQHYGGRGIFNGGVVQTSRRVMPSRVTNGNVAEKGDFTVTAVVFNPPGKGGATATSVTTYKVP